MVTTTVLDRNRVDALFTEEGAYKDFLLTLHKELRTYKRSDAKYDLYRNIIKIIVHALVTSHRNIRVVSFALRKIDKHETVHKNIVCVLGITVNGSKLVNLVTIVSNEFT